MIEIYDANHRASPMRQKLKYFGVKEALKICVLGIFRELIYDHLVSLSIEDN